MAEANKEDNITATVRTTDGHVIVSSIETLRLSGLFRNKLKKLESSTEMLMTPILIEEIKGPILEKIIEWCDHYKYDHVVYEENRKPLKVSELLQKGLPEWDRDFLETNLPNLREIIIAANTMNIPVFLGNISKFITEIIRTKTEVEMAVLFRKRYNTCTIRNGDDLMDIMVKCAIQCKHLSPFENICDDDKRTGDEFHC